MGLGKQRNRWMAAKKYIKHGPRQAKKYRAGRERNRWMGAKKYVAGRERNS